MFSSFIFLLLTVPGYYFNLVGYKTNFFLNFILTNIFLSILFLYCCDSFMLLLFILELFSVYYYFFFINVHVENKKFCILQYKNLLLFFLWNAFLTTIVYGLGLFFLVVSCGTLNFYELSLINNAGLEFSLVLILVSFF